jgi:hypothetical protein
VVAVSTSVPAEHTTNVSNRSAPHFAAGTTDHDADTLIEAIEAAPVATAGDGVPPWTEHDDLTLPGFGPLAQDCGQDFPFFCSGCGDVKNFGRTCYQSTCSRCAPAWARRTATRVVAKLRALRAYYDEARSAHQRLHHIVVSPPRDYHPGEEPHWESAYDTVKRILKTAGHAGWLCYHPRRGKDDDDRGFWKEHLFNNSDADQLDDETRFAPHFHAIVVGHQTPGGDVSKEIEARTGWVIHRITKQDSNVSLYDEYDLARAVTYCLSHAGIIAPDDGQSRVCANHFGRYTNNATATDAEEAANDAVVRAVAPKTLGLPFNRLACDAERAVDCEVCDDDHDHDDVLEAGSDHYERVDVAAAAASRHRDPFVATDDARLPRENPRLENPDPSLTSGSGVSAADGGSSSNEDGGADDPLVDEATADESTADDQDGRDGQAPETERCSGRMLPISKAPPFLHNQEWCEQAAHADRLEPRAV